MSLKHFCCLLLLTSVVAVGDTITFTGPEDSSGTPCSPYPTNNHCIIGDPLIYDIFSASITQPASPGGLWTLTIETNYGVTLPGPAGGPVIPNYPFESDSISLGIGDFLFEWNGGFYGIVLTPHDGYAAGSIYEASGFQDSLDVMTAAGVPSFQIPRPSLPVLLNGGGTLKGAGTLSASANAGSDGVNTALYTITDTFSESATFLNSPFTVDFSSYVCANGFLTGGTGGFTGGTGGGGTTPEPSSWLLILPGIVLVGVAQLRKKRA